MYEHSRTSIIDSIGSYRYCSGDWTNSSVPYRLDMECGGSSRLRVFNYHLGTGMVVDAFDASLDPIK